MKKITLLSFALILATALFSQKISLGPEVGVNLIHTEKTELGNDYQLGMHFGIQVRYNLNEHFAISSGVYATQKKKKYTTVDTTTTPDLVGGLLGGFLGGGAGNSEANVYNTTKGLVSELYLEIPILMHYKIKNVDFFAGPYTNILLNANRKEVTTSESTAVDPTSLIPGGFGGLGGLLSGLTSSPDEGSTESTSTEGLSATDFGVIAGVGYHVNNLQFNLMYTYGFLDYRTDIENEAKINHEVIRFSVAYLFKFKKKVDTEATGSPRFQ